MERKYLRAAVSHQLSAVSQVQRICTARLWFWAFEDAALIPALYFLPEKRLAKAE